MGSDKKCCWCRAGRQVEALSPDCVTRQEERDTVERLPVVTCVHRNISQCHHTFTTQYLPVQQQAGQQHLSGDTSQSFTFIFISSEIVSQSQQHLV